MPGAVVDRGSGRTLGPLALRRWRLFVPVGATARKPLPLLVLLHGCAQDSAAFAAVTRAAVVARAHGFAVLSEHAVFNYLCTDVYVKEADAGVRWNDAGIAVDWPVSAPTLSAKDEAAPFLTDIPEDRLPVYQP